MATKEDTAIESLKNDLVAMVSHELRAPLSTIQATVKLVASGFQGEISASQKEMLTLALDNIERMGRIVNQLLDSSKIESGGLRLNARRIDWVRILRDVTQSFEPLARERGLQLLVDVPQTFSEGFVDKDHMVQIITNLLHNAIKFTPSGHITVGFREEPNSVRFWVADTGPGFKPKDLPHIFRKFKRFGTPSRPQDIGSGLGLSLTKSLVELHGGTIRVDSRPGEGAVFTVTIPRIPADKVFEQEALRLMHRAQDNEKSLSIAEIRIQNWTDIITTLGRAASDTLMNYVEAQLRTSLRDDFDFIVQRPGALWLAVFSSSKVEAHGVIRRLEKTIQENSLLKATGTSVQLDFNVVTYPEDHTDPNQIINLLNSAAAA